MEESGNNTKHLDKESLDQSAPPAEPEEGVQGLGNDNLNDRTVGRVIRTFCEGTSGHCFGKIVGSKCEYQAVPVLCGRQHNMSQIWIVTAIHSE